MHEPNGFYYMRARYYDPDVCRFISEDPSGFSGGDVNLYAYCGNNPINFADPFGLCAEGGGGWTETALQGIGIALIGLTADDATGIGVLDDPLIPVLVAAGVGVAVIQAANNSGSGNGAEEEKEHRKKHPKDHDKHTKAQGHSSKKNSKAKERLIKEGKWFFQ